MLQVNQVLTAVWLCAGGYRCVAGEPGVDGAVWLCAGATVPVF